MKTVTFEEFIESMHLDIDLFQQQWKDLNLTNPSKYPMELPYDQEGTWFGELIKDITGADLKFNTRK